MPEEMYSLEDRSGLVGLLDGVVWQFGNDGAPIRPVSDLSSGKITALIRSNRFTSGTKYRYNDLISRQIVVRFGNGPDTKLAFLDLSTGELSKLETPSNNASLLDYEGSSSLALLIDSSDTTTLWVAGREGNRRQITSVNDFVKEVAPLRSVRFNYQTEDGEEVGADLLLPTDYSPGHRYPLVVWVYPGSHMATVEGGFMPNH